MMSSENTLIVLGGSGFIGRQVITEAVKDGWKVKALARSENSAQIIRAAGAESFEGEAENPKQWIHEVEGARVIIDLIQPQFPKRIGGWQLSNISKKRRDFTVALVSQLVTIREDRRPILISVSGIDDLAPDKEGYISADSPLRADNYGFSRVGIPVRKVIEHSKIKATFVYLGTVYGPGKSFGETIFPSLAAGKWKNFGQGSNHIILIHVEDAARGLVRIAESEISQVVGKSSVLTDDRPVEMKSFFDFAASLMGVPAPGQVPRWLASIVVGRPLIETMLCDVPVKSSDWNFSDFRLKFPTYREGLPKTLEALGYLNRQPASEVRS